eukprot:1182105-Prorocentrum_minimum.AAC.1
MLEWAESVEQMLTLAKSSMSMTSPASMRPSMAASLCITQLSWSVNGDLRPSAAHGGKDSSAPARPGCASSARKESPPTKTHAR